MRSVETGVLFDLSHTACGESLGKCLYPWQALPLIGGWIIALGQALPASTYRQYAPDVWIARSAQIAEGVRITGPCIIGSESELRTGSFVRGCALIGEGCVVGNSTELKNVILFDGVQVPHFNYVGDSILGYRAHLGAGAITSNVRLDRGCVCVRSEYGVLQTGLKKLGAMIGDRAEVGCNSVLNPGTVLGRGSVVYPLCSVRGVLRAGAVWRG